MRRQKTDPSLKANPKVEELIAQFKPEFGNQMHIDIVKAYANVLDLHRIMKMGEERRRELKRETIRSKARIKEIEEKEKHLCWMLEQVIKINN